MNNAWTEVLVIKRSYFMDKWVTVPHVNRYVSNGDVRYADLRSSVSTGCGFVPVLFPLVSDSWTVCLSACLSAHPPVCLPHWYASRQPRRAGRDKPLAANRAAALRVRTADKAGDGNLDLAEPGSSGAGLERFVDRRYLDSHFLLGFRAYAFFFFFVKEQLVSGMKRKEKKNNSRLDVHLLFTVTKKTLMNEVGNTEKYIWSSYAHIMISECNFFLEEVVAEKEMLLWRFNTCGIE